jgi:hypothetical protein
MLLWVVVCNRGGEVYLHLCCVKRYSGDERWLPGLPLPLPKQYRYPWMHDGCSCIKFDPSLTETTHSSDLTIECSEEGLFGGGGEGGFYCYIMKYLHYVPIGHGTFPNR